MIVKPVISSNLSNRLNRQTYTFEILYFTDIEIISIKKTLSDLKIPFIKTESKITFEVSKDILNVYADDKFSIVVKSIHNYINRISAEKKVKIMGILNVTPDSFSDGGKYSDINSAVARALQMHQEGADIIDIGGESTRPGSDYIDEKEEIRRVLPVIEKIKNIDSSIVVSVDTQKKNVAKLSLEAGADIINDISGLTFEPEIAEVVANFNKTLILMHIKGNPKNMQINPTYNELIPEIYEFLYRQIELAKSMGVADLIIDPGIGFGKSVQNNYEILNRIDEFNSLGEKILIGLSRKSFLGKSLNLEVAERENATIIAETLSILNGADYIRTHNVKNVKQAIDIINYFQNPGLSNNV